jgi:hypothetical protein
VVPASVEMKSRRPVNSDVMFLSHRQQRLTSSRVRATARLLLS